MKCKIVIFLLLLLFLISCASNTKTSLEGKTTVKVTTAELIREEEEDEKETSVFEYSFSIREILVNGEVSSSFISSYSELFSYLSSDAIETFINDEFEKNLADIGILSFSVFTNGFYIEFDKQTDASKLIQLYADDLRRYLDSALFSKQESSIINRQSIDVLVYNMDPMPENSEIPKATQLPKAYENNEYSTTSTIPETIEGSEQHSECSVLEIDDCKEQELVLSGSEESITKSNSNSEGYITKIPAVEKSLFFSFFESLPVLSLLHPVFTALFMFAICAVLVSSLRKENYLFGLIRFLNGFVIYILLFAFRISWGASLFFGFIFTICPVFGFFILVVVFRKMSSEQMFE